MQETAEQYRARLLAAIDGMNPLRVQAETPGKIHRLLRDSNPAAWARQPAPGVWSAAEIVAHLADCEFVYGYRIRLILGNPGTPIQPFNQDHWAERMEYKKQSPLDSLRAFAALRAVNLRLLRRLTPEQMQFHGEHSERGPETVEMIVAMLAGHDLNHLRQIEDRVPRRRTAAAGKRKPAAGTGRASAKGRSKAR